MKLIDTYEKSRSAHLQVLDLVQQVTEVLVELRGALAHVEVAAALRPSAFERESGRPDALFQTVHASIILSSS